MDNTTKGYNGPKYRVRYTEEFKHQLCREYLSGNYTKTELQEKYGIKGKCRLLSWLRELGYMKYIRENEIKIMRHYKKKYRIKQAKISKQSERSPEQIRDLENALWDAQLQVSAYSKMIEIAEQQYKIKIRKNLNTK